MCGARGAGGFEVPHEAFWQVQQIVCVASIIYSQAQRLTKTPPPPWFELSQTVRGNGHPTSVWASTALYPHMTTRTSQGYADYTLSCIHRARLFILEIDKQFLEHDVILCLMCPSTKGLLGAAARGGETDRQVQIDGEAAHRQTDRLTDHTK